MIPFILLNGLIHCTCRQRVIIDGESSCWAPVTSGVPQGSVLGPLLFLIYINDIDYHLKSSIRLFADDCVLYNKITSKADCEVLQSDLNGILTWSQIWQLSLCSSKCKVMRITNKRSHIHATYSISNHPLEWCESMKYLGVTINTSKLKWSDQVNGATLKATRLQSLKLLCAPI